MSKGYTISNFQASLKTRLQQYIEAQYHLRNEELVLQRRKLLEAETTLCREPYLETTKAYRKLKGYSAANLPESISRMFEELSEAAGETGIVPTPFSHQIEALDSFVNQGSNLIITTGTGSGKTETFLYPLIANLIKQAEKNSAPGVMKSIILYPMNALVADQTTRLRKLLGSNQSVEQFQSLIGRPLTFANYTSATPYAGSFKKNRSKSEAEGLEQLYCVNPQNQAEQDYKDSLEANYRTPAKVDLSTFIEKLKTVSKPEDLLDSRDSELILRAEVQLSPPDLLVTNFSMLEYMLLRPIEQSVFDNTSAWLAESEQNMFTLILDEAHIYNGVSGSEVALLIRRLFSRLGAKSQQVRVLIASASLGEAGGHDSILENAARLTGLDRSSFKVIEHQLEFPPVQKKLTQPVITLLEDIKPVEITEYLIANEDSRRITDAKIESVLNLYNEDSLGFDALTFAEKLYRVFSGLDIFAALKKELTNPHSLSEIESFVRDFIAGEGLQTQDVHQLAEVLLNIGSTACKDSKTSSEMMLPVRSHSLFRGLPGLYLCLNSSCGNADSKFGKMYSDKRTICECGSKVYELAAHNECGSAFIRGYWAVQDCSEDYSSAVIYPDGGNNGDQQLKPVYLCIDDHDSTERLRLELNPRTGQFTDERRAEYCRVSISYDVNEFKPRLVDTSFGAEESWFDYHCPRCGNETIIGYDKKAEEAHTLCGSLRIRSLATVGDAPFNYLVKEQFSLQPPKPGDFSIESNFGRKSLLFSDGRQKAARIAKDLPETIQRDVFRSYLINAYLWLQSDEAEELLREDEDGFELDRKTKETLDPEVLYYGFLHVCKISGKLFFEGRDRDTFELHLDKFKRLDVIPRQEIPKSFVEYLVVALGTLHYNITDLAIAGIRVKRAKKSARTLGLDPQLVDAFFSKRARDFLLAGSISVDYDVIYRAFNYPERDGHKLSWRLNPAGNNRSTRRNRAIDVAPESFEQLNEEFKEKALSKVPTADGELKYKLNLASLYLEIAYDKAWHQCKQCLFLSDIILPDGRCPACGVGQEHVQHFDENSEYFSARKLFWRDPIRHSIDDITNELFIEVGEHTAQLNYRDGQEKAISTVVENELRFQDLLDPRKTPKSTVVDILSSTTTMEVGIDIGGLIAVAMRNVPPQRQNYQQRAGRAGRRGSAFSTVVTYCQKGSHDSYYYQNPEKMISGPVSPIHLHPDQKALADRHLLAVLVSAYFREFATQNAKNAAKTPNIFSHLGSLRSFMSTEAPSLSDFEFWLKRQDTNQFGWYADLGLSPSQSTLETLAKFMREQLENHLDDLDRKGTGNESVDPELLGVLFDRGCLPSYAFPRDLVQFEITSVRNNKLVVEEKPTFGITQALQELAPGRTVVINKNLYQVGSLTASSLLSSDKNKAAALFSVEQLKTYFQCSSCKTLHTNEQSMCCSKQSLRKINVIKPEYAAPRPKFIELSNSDTVFTTSQEAQIVEDGSELTSGQANRCRAEHTVSTFDQVRIARINEGVPQQSGKGFLVCERCGAASPPHTFDEELGYHEIDYPVQSPQGTLKSGQRCFGTIRQVAIGHDFLTQVSSLKIKVPGEFIASDGVKMSSQLQGAATSLALAIRNSFSRYQDIDPKDVGFGARLIPDGATGWLQLFFYDDNAGGAGYASEVAGVIGRLLIETERSLNNCSCDSRCYQCLSSYETRFIDDKLNRYLALSLLHFVREGELKLDGEQKYHEALLKGLAAELEEFGINLEKGRISKGSSVLELLFWPSLGKKPSDQENSVYLTPFELANELASVTERIRKKLA